MLVNFIKVIHGYVQIKIEGNSLERFLNICNRNQLKLWSVENKGQYYILCIGIKDYKKLRPFAKKTATKVTIIKKYGIPVFFNKFRKRNMFFAGILMCVLLIYILSLFVWNIHLEGNVTQNNEELLEYLSSINVKHGSLKSNISCENIESSLRNTYPNILWVSAEMKGTRIFIQIKENMDEDIVSKVETTKEEFLSIAAAVSGRVESIIVRQGTPLVSIGDEVTEGQILVEGYYPIKNDAGESVSYNGVHANADIVIVKEELYRDEFSKEYFTKNYTKRKKFGIRIILFDKCINLIPKINYENCDMTSKLIEFRITENFYFPIKIEFLMYKEYLKEKKSYTEKELISKANERYLNKYKNILRKGVQIIEKNVKIDTDGNLCVVRGNVSLAVSYYDKIPAVLPEAPVGISGEGDY